MPEPTLTPGQLKTLRERIEEEIHKVRKLQNALRAELQWIESPENQRQFQPTILAERKERASKEAQSRVIELIKESEVFAALALSQKHRWDLGYILRHSRFIQHSSIPSPTGVMGSLEAVFQERLAAQEMLLVEMAEDARRARVLSEMQMMDAESIRETIEEAGLYSNLPVLHVASLVVQSKTWPPETHTALEEALSKAQNALELPEREKALQELQEIEILTEYLQHIRNWASGLHPEDLSISLQRSRAERQQREVVAKEQQSTDQPPRRSEMSPQHAAQYILKYGRGQYLRLPQ